MYRDRHCPQRSTRAGIPVRRARLRAVTVERTVELQFGESARAADTHTNLSAVRSDGPVLWVAGDETATLERLVADDPDRPRRYAQQTSFPLADRKSTRLNSSHANISYAVFCLKKTDHRQLLREVPPPRSRRTAPRTP